MFALIIYPFIVGISAIACWSFMSLPNYWMASVPAIPAKRLSIIIALGIQVLILASNPEFEAGIVTFAILSILASAFMGAFSAIVFILINISTR